MTLPRHQLAAAAAVLPLATGCAGSGTRPAGPAPSRRSGPPTAAQPTGPPAGGWRPPAASASGAAISQPPSRYGSTSPRSRSHLPGAARPRAGRHSRGAEPVRPCRLVRPGPRPGDPGPAVILGHVDSDRGPAVFYRLGEPRPGDQLTVTGADGSSVRLSSSAPSRIPRTGPDRRRLLPHPAAGDLRRGVRPHHRPLPVQCDRLRHHGALTCPPGSTGLQLALVHDLPVVGQGLGELG
jgi:hypothetical protein